MQIILASTSPRRIELMKKFKIPCRVVASQFEENNTLKMPPVKLAVYNASQKARAVRKLVKNPAIIIGADTIVVLGRRVLGKPHTKKRARETLRLIRGKTVTVLCALALYNTSTDTLRTSYDRAYVTMKHYSDADIERYIATGEPLDRAGSFAIQGKGKALVASHKGDLYTIIGLPVRKLTKMLKAIKII